MGRRGRGCRRCVRCKLEAARTPDGANTAAMEHANRVTQLVVLLLQLSQAGNMALWYGFHFSCCFVFVQAFLA